MNFKRFETQVPSEYQELTFISNNGTQYIDTGLKGSDLADCELEIVMRNDTALTTGFNFNGTYLSGSTAQFGLVATSSSECRSSMNFGFAGTISTTGLNISEFHTIYATNGLQKVDNAVVGTLNFGTLNNGRFLLFARTDPNVTSGVNVCAAMSLKSFTVKRNNQYIRNMIPAKRKSDNTFGLYDTVNDVFYTNQGTGDFTGGAVVEPTWHDIPYYIHNTSTDTLTTLPAVLYPNDTTATVGLKGQMEQSGTPTPQNPIQPQECGERTGNLFDYVLYFQTIQPWSGSDYFDYGILHLSPNTTYTFSTNFHTGISGSLQNVRDVPFIVVDSNTNPSTAIGGFGDDGSASVTTLSDGIIRLFKRIQRGSPSTDLADLPTLSDFQNGKWVMCNVGSEVLPYEPYGIKIPISSASTTTPVYLGEVPTTRRIKKLVLTGEENIEIKSGNAKWYIPIADMKTPTNTRVIEWYCSHYQAVANTASWTSYDYMISWSSADSGSLIGLRIRDIDFLTGATVSDFKAYLAAQYAAGTPVTVWYVLATPTTGIVNEPLRKIGDYADTVSGITIPTITGKDTFDVQTTLKPSGVSLAYTGWHDAQSVHEKSSNLFDKSTAISGERILARSVIADATVAHSDYIDVTGISNLAVSHKYTGTNFYFYSDKTNDSIGYVNGYTADVPTGAKYCRINIQIEDLNNTMLNTGSSALPYEPYWT